MTKIEKKQCAKCNEVKELTEFYSHKLTQDRLYSSCKTCHSKHTTKNRKAAEGSFERKTIMAKDNASRSAQRHGVENTLTLEEYRAVLSTERCSYCNKEVEEKKRTLDHVIPMQEGGANTFDNVVMACKPCNVAKLNRPVYDFIMKQRNVDATSRLLDVLAERMELSRHEVLQSLQEQHSAYNEKLFRERHGLAEDAV